ncbi:unnamed protein product [Rotaria sordida]|uniref:DUF4371 domain-containing protein n=1 Tax=Rotaria sordida TaxID=392033 RepID=A0A818ZYX1_9BILA|nr:unnamed protein product [Rotaria sordida]
MATITVSMKIICPDCDKQMAKKNWKDHARQKHTMTEDTIKKKYEELLPSTSINHETNQIEIISTTSTNNVNFDSNECDYHLSQDNYEIVVKDKECSLNINSATTNSADTLSNYDQSSSSILIQTPVKTMLDVSNNIVTSIKGVRFINSHEMTIIQKQRSNHPDIPWNSNKNLPSAKPSSAWFSTDHPWLRAIRTDNQYGLLCVDCGEFASNEAAIKKSQGAFIVRPYWKYWSWEAIAEWLQSIDKYVHYLQTSSIRKTRYINIIMDEARDITANEMLCLCLRYVEEDSGNIREEGFMFKPIMDGSGEGVFNIAREFIECLQQETNKELIITAQTYDGASSMRYQAQGHVRSRLSAWAIYIYCHSHLLNLSVQDAIEIYIYDIYDTVHSTLVFLRDSSVRLQVLYESQKLINSVVIALSTISQQKTSGSSHARRFAFELMKPEVVFQIHLMHDVLRPSLQFLRQIEKRGSCLDEFVTHVDAARNTIKQSIEIFDFNQVRKILNDVQKYLPTVEPTFRSTRSQIQTIATDFDEEQFRDTGKTFINHFLQSLDDRFNTEAQELIKNIAVLSSPFKFSAEELLQNSLIIQTDPPLLNYQQLKNDVFAFLTIVGNITSITSITQRLAQHGSEQCPEWYKLFQILATFGIGLNEAERTFSTLKRIKSWLRNGLSNSTLEILIKVSSLKVNLTDDAIKFIIDDFISNPQRAKRRNISVFTEYNNEMEFDEETV